MVSLYYVVPCAGFLVLYGSGIEYSADTGLSASQLVLEDSIAESNNAVVHKHYLTSMSIFRYVWHKAKATAK